MTELPGVGWSLGQRLEQLGITKCAHVLAKSREYLQRELGDKTGALIWAYAQVWTVPCSCSGCLTCPPGPFGPASQKILMNRDLEVGTG